MHRFALILSLIAGMGVGGFASSVVRSQADPPAYFVTLFDTASAADMANTNYPSLAPATFQPFGGRYLIHGGRTVSFDGQPPKQIVVVAFESMTRLQEWHGSQAFRELYDVFKSGKVQAFAVEGVGSDSAGAFNGRFAHNAPQ